MDNNVIRNRALYLYKKNRILLMAIAFVQILPSFPANVINMLIPRDRAVLSAVVIALLNATLFYPAINIGACYLALKIWWGEDAKFSLFFHFYNKNDYPGTFLMGGVIALINFFFHIPSYTGVLNGSYGNNPILALISALTWIIVIIFQTWLLLRLIAAPYLFAIGRSRNPISLVEESFRIMKNNIGGYIRFFISVFWWRILILISVIITSIILVSVIGLNNGHNINIIVLGILFIGTLAHAILNPYPMLAINGYIYNLIPPVKNNKENEITIKLT